VQSLVSLEFASLILNHSCNTVLCACKMFFALFLSESFNKRSDQMLAFDPIVGEPFFVTCK
jgi:hypothetical protein